MICCMVSNDHMSKHFISFHTPSAGLPLPPVLHALRLVLRLVLRSMQPRASVVNSHNGVTMTSFVRMGSLGRTSRESPGRTSTLIGL